jgi:hypothetical protein
VADIRYQIVFQAVSAGDGGTQLQSQLDGIKKSVNDINQSTQQGAGLNTLGTSMKSAADQASLLEARGRLAAGQTSALAKQLQGAGTSAQAATGSVAALGGSAASTAGNIARATVNTTNLVGALAQGKISAEAASKAVGLFGGAAGGAAAGYLALAFAALKAVEGADALGGKIAQLILDLQGFNESGVDAEQVMLRIARQDMALQDKIDKANELTEAFKRQKTQLDAMQSLFAAQREAQIGQQMAREERVSAERIAAAGGDPAVKQAEEARLAVVRAELEAAKKSQQAEAEIAAAKSEVAFLKMTQTQTEKASNDATERKRRIETLIEQAAAELGLSYKDAVTLAKNNDALQARINKALEARAAYEEGVITKTQSGEGIMEAGSLQRLQDAVGKMEEATTAAATAQGEFQTNMDKLNQANVRLETAQINAATASEQMATDLITARTTMQTAMQSLQARLAEAQATAAAEGQGAAAAAAIQQANAIRQQIADLAVTSTGQAQAAAEQAVASGQAISASADQFGAATTQGAASMTRGISGMSTAVTGMANQFTNSINSLTATIATRMAQMEARIANLQSSSGANARSADVANQQIIYQR